MPDYCSNSVEFIGENSEKVLEHFRAIGEDAPPFQAILVYDDKVNFESKWTPPIRDLNAIAERFDVSYRLIYQVKGKPTESLYYTCLQHEPMSGAAEKIRDVINSVSTPEDFHNAELMAGELFYHRTLDLHDLGAIACLLKKQSFKVDRLTATHNDISSEPGRKPWESGEQSTGIKRQR